MTRRLFAACELSLSQRQQPEAPQELSDTALLGPSIPLNPGQCHVAAILHWMFPRRTRQVSHAVWLEHRKCRHPGWAPAAPHRSSKPAV